MDPRNPISKREQNDYRINQNANAEHCGYQGQKYIDEHVLWLILCEKCNKNEKFTFIVWNFVILIELYFELFLLQKIQRKEETILCSKAAAEIKLPCGFHRPIPLQFLS